MTYFICNCCGAGFDSDKEQDPNRDRRFGTCPSCIPSIAKDAERFGFHIPDEGTTYNPDRVLEHFERYA